MANNADPNDPVQAAGDAVRRMAVDEDNADDLDIRIGRRNGRTDFNALSRASIFCCFKVIIR